MTIAWDSCDHWGLSKFIEDILEAHKEALKQGIRANMVLINKKLGITKAFVFGTTVFPPMVCGMEMQVTDKLPDDVAFAIMQATRTEREKLVAETKRETAKEILDLIEKNKFNIGKALYEQTIDEDCDVVSKYGLKLAISKKYGVEVDG